MIGIPYLKPGPGGLKINSKPSAAVYINGAYTGITPYTGKHPPGALSLKLIPGDGKGNLPPYETKLNLVSGIQTVVDREFSESEESASGDVVSFERIGGKKAAMLAISSPDNAEVWIDGSLQGYTPYNFSTITTGSHKVVIKSAGYIDRPFNAKTINGLRLTIYAKLARGENPNLNPSPSPTPAPTPSGTVLIKDTPTGFLRMRTAPGSKGEEIAELKPGQKYPYLETDTETGWYKIQYQPPAPGLPNGIVGWISSQYSTLTLGGESPTSSPSPSAPAP